MTERVFAAIVLAACALLLVRLVIGQRRRSQVDAALRSFVVRMCLGVRSFGQRRRAARAADDAIRRARDRGEWDGNVYKPKSFRKPPRDKTH